MAGNVCYLVIRTVPRCIWQALWLQVTRVFMAFQASCWNDLCGWHRCCSDPDFSFNYWIYLAVLIMAMKSPISLLFSCTPQPILSPWNNVAILAAVFFLFVVAYRQVLVVRRLCCSSTKPLRSFTQLDTQWHGGSACDT